MEIRVIETIAGIAAHDWDACAGTHNPFVRHAYLAALETSGSAAPETGWHPRHLVAGDAAGRIMGVVPLYLKTHSYGEYVFDWSWADAFERAGGQYYPKLLSAVPFAPATGPRLLVRADAPDGTQALLARALVTVAERLGVSSAHVLFSEESECDLLAGAGFLRRSGEQFHWRNDGYDTFDDFLGALSSRKRKAIRRERREVRDTGVEVRVLAGGDITEADWNVFYGFYITTSGRKWGRAYLTRAFFTEIGRTMTDATVLMLAMRDGQTIAGALNFQGADTLFGRWWGAAPDTHVPFLHFELCYYQAIERAIALGLDRVGAGAQGPHKLARGYLPVETLSAHWIADAGFRRAVEAFVEQERAAVTADMEELAELGPFRRE